MSLSYRARAIDATTRRVPAEDVIRLVRPAQNLQVLQPTYEARSPQAAYGGLEFVKMLPLRPSNPVRPASRWRRESLPEGVEPEKLPERATGMLEEVANVMER